jgi:4'-phosphopantetheinyl transferase
MSHARSPSAGEAVHVAFARTAEMPAIGGLLEWLDGAERERYERFHGAEDRAMFLLGRVMARALVGRAAGVDPKAWQWREAPRGRPEIAWPATTLQFNLAHSAGLVVCALAAGRDVGVDVEDFERRPVEPAVVRRYCSPAEVADIERHGDRWHDRFLLYWTLKEAYLKARGLGIAVQLADISFSLDAGAPPRVGFLGSLAGTDTRWQFHVARPTERHVVAIAAASNDGLGVQFEIAPFEWTLARLPR